MAERRIAFLWIVSAALAMGGVWACDDEPADDGSPQDTGGGSDSNADGGDDLGAEDATGGDTTGNDTTGNDTSGTDTNLDVVSDLPGGENSLGILFVTQVPIPADFTSIASVFGNHRGDLDSVGRGGDLYIRYWDGTLRNLTREAGYGEEGPQGDDAIAVRDPAVHWDGQRALFSMVVGGPSEQYEYEDYFWQIYEITGLGPDDTPAITLVPNQPENYNNITPFYGTDERILFTSDRPRDGQAHLYPQLDEYEEAPTVTGIWSLDPESGGLFLLDHSPSGDFSPFIDSYGRVIFTRWDHLQRDQQADSDSAGGEYGTFNYSNESAAAAMLDNRDEVFPEPRAEREDLIGGTNLEGHSFNHFFPWMCNEDGTDLETLNHIGRHELHGYFNRSLNDDSGLTEFIDDGVGRTNPNEIQNLLQIREDPLVPGDYYGIDAPEFGTHSAGQVVAIQSAPNVNADDIVVRYVTHRDTASFLGEGESPSADHSGHYRDPLPLTNGTLIASHTGPTYYEANIGDREHPQSYYAFRLVTLEHDGDNWAAAQLLTEGIPVDVSYWDPDFLVTLEGTSYWELQPVEVVARTRPARRESEIADPEQSIIDELDVDVATLQAWMRDQDVALVISRNVTTRDDADLQQPYNLRLYDGDAESLAGDGTVYEVAWMQFFQGDLIRGVGRDGDEASPGRRVLAQPMHDAISLNPAAGTAPGSIALGSDGSMAAFVPARRALSWQLIDPTNTPVVRERYWLTFQPGEIRTCPSCHGANDRVQTGELPPTNPPAALRTLLEAWQAEQ